jgi:hypothetical protein
VDVEFDEDRFRITYDPAKLTPEQMLETVRKQGLEGSIVP